MDVVTEMVEYDPKSGNKLPICKTPFDKKSMVNALGRVIGGEIDDLTAQAGTSAAAAQKSAQYAQQAETSIKQSIATIPPGAVPVINDLTTGGATVALSAEQGKVLDEKKAEKTAVDSAFASVNASLSNKANVAEAFIDRKEAITGSVLTAALEKPPGTYLVSAEAADTPVASAWYYAKIYDVLSGHRMIELDASATLGYKGIYTNTYNQNDAAWRGWEGPYATATPPQEYDLPLAAGTGTCQYGRYQDGKAFADVFFTGQSIGSGVIIVTLPAGYRPKRDVQKTVNVWIVDVGNRICIMNITALGTISIDTLGYGAAGGCNFSCDFRAA